MREVAAELHRRAATRGMLAAGLLIIALASANRGAGSAAALIGVAAIYVGRGAVRQHEVARRYRLGAQAEERVGSSLECLSELGAVVEHDVRKAGRGNVDHIVHIGTLTFTIDTKRSGWRERDLDQAYRHAAWAEGRYGADRTFVPVICIQRSARAVELVEGVYVVGGERLVPWLRDTL